MSCHNTFAEEGSSNAHAHRDTPLSFDPNLDYRIISTALDAILAKHATAQAGYYNDAFANIFCQDELLKQSRPRHFQPLIKRGTFARVCVMDRAIRSFLTCHSTNKIVDIIVLGAGKDTSFFRFVAGSIMGMDPSPKARSQLPKVNWKEVDHASVVEKKAKIIHAHPILSQCCPNLSKANEENDSEIVHFKSKEGRYELVGADLRDDPAVLWKRLRVQPTRPTLVLVECVWMYLPHLATTKLLQEFTKRCQVGYVTAYEPMIQTDSQFGRVMQDNLVRKAQVATPDSGLLTTRTLMDHLKTYCHEAGWGRAVGCSMETAYQTCLTQDQRQVASRTEFLDELEEWSLIMRHYCFVVASTGADTNSLMKVGPESLLGFQKETCETLTKD